MSYLRKILHRSETLHRMFLLLGVIWYLFVCLLSIVLIPIFIFLPQSFTSNFNKIITKAALKILWFIWRVIKKSFFIALVLVLIPLTPVLIIWAWLCGTLWAWTVSGGKPTLETKSLVFSVLGMFGFFLMIISGILGLAIGAIGFANGQFLAPIIGGVGGFFIWLYPTVDCFELEKKTKQEIEARNQPYFCVKSDYWQ